MNPQERLISAVSAIQPRLKKMRRALSRINDAPDFEKLLDALEEIARVHGVSPDTTIATEFATLRSQLSQFDISPEQHDDSEDIEQRWDALNGARGNLYIGIDDVLVAAAALNIRPEKIELHLSNDNPILRDEARGLKALVARLDRLEQMLREKVEPEGMPGPGRSAAQTIQVNQYLAIMRRSTRLFRLTLNVGDKIDLGAVERLIASMGRITRELQVTVTSAASRATQALRAAAEAVKKPLGRLLDGVRTTARWEIRARTQTEVDFEESVAPKGRRGPAGSRAYAIGDVHGRLDLLQLLIAKIKADRRKSAAARDYLILLGDLIDRGPDSRGVVEFLMNLLPGDMRLVFLVGNHEEMMLRVLGGESEVVHQWLTFGGYEFAKSYGVEVGKLATLPPVDAAAMIREKIPSSHLKFIEEFADSFTFGDYLFVHAGIRPGRKLAKQETHDLRWIREEFTNYKRDHGCIVVHGHTISQAPEVLDNRIGLDTGAYQTGILTAVRIEGDRRRIITADERDL